MGFKEGSGNLKRGSSFNVGEEGAGVDTATTMPFHAPSSSYSPTPTVVRPFHALKENCSLKIEVFSKFKDRFQFPEGTRARLPKKGEKACALPMGKFAFMRLLFRVASGSPSIRSSWSFFIILTLHRDNLCPILGE